MRFAYWVVLSRIGCLYNGIVWQGVDRVSGLNPKHESPVDAVLLVGLVMP